MMPEMRLFWMDGNVYDVSRFEWDFDAWRLKTPNSRKIIISREILQNLTQIHYDFMSSDDTV